MQTMRVRDVMLIVMALVCCAVWWSHEYSLEYDPVFKIDVDNIKETEESSNQFYTMPQPLLVSLPIKTTAEKLEQKLKEGEKRFLLLASTPNILAMYDLHLLMSSSSFSFVSNFVHTRDSSSSSSSSSKRSNSINTVKNKRSKKDIMEEISAKQALRYRIHFNETIVAFITHVFMTKQKEQMCRLFVLTSDYTLHAYDVMREIIPSLRWQTRILPQKVESSVPTHAALQVMLEGIYTQDNGTVFVAVEAIDTRSRKYAATDEDNYDNSNNNNIDDKNNNAESAILYAALHADDGALRWSMLSNNSNVDYLRKNLNNNDDYLQNHIDNVINNADDTFHNVLLNEMNREVQQQQLEHTTNNEAEHATVNNYNKDFSTTTTTTTTTTYSDSSNDNTIEKQKILSTSKLIEREHAYEWPWNHFWMEVLEQLPHYFSHNWDEYAEIRHFAETHSDNDDDDEEGRIGRSLLEAILAQVEQMNKNSQKEIKQEVHQQEQEEEEQEEEESNKQEQTHEPSPNVLIYHGKHGIEVVHLHTGYILTRAKPLKPYTVFYHNIDYDTLIDALTIECDKQLETKEAVHLQRSLFDKQHPHCAGIGYTRVLGYEREVFRVSLDEPSKSSSSIYSIHNSLSRYSYLYRGSHKIKKDNVNNNIIIDGNGDNTDDAHYNTQDNHKQPAANVDVSNIDSVAVTRELSQYSAQSIILVRTYTEKPVRQFTDDYNSHLNYNYNNNNNDDNDNVLHKHKVNMKHHVNNLLNKWEQSLLVFMSPTGLLTCVDVADKKVVWQNKVMGPSLHEVMSLEDVARYNLLLEDYESPHNEVEENKVNKNKVTLPHLMPFVHITPFALFSSNTATSSIKWHSEGSDTIHSDLSHHLSDQEEEEQQKRESYSGDVLQDSNVNSKQSSLHYNDNNNVNHFLHHQRYHHFDYVLAVRDRYLTVVNVHSGTIVSSLQLSEPPTAPVIVVDLNNDGVSDLLVVTNEHVLGLCGYIKSTSTCMRETFLFSLFVLALLVVWWEYQRQRQRMRDKVCSTNNHASNNITKPAQLVSNSKRAIE